MTCLWYAQEHATDKKYGNDKKSILHAKIYYVC